MLIVLLVSSLLQFVGLVVLGWKLWPHTPIPPQLPAIAPPTEGVVRLLKRVDGVWVRHCERPAGHRDVLEAFNTPGLAYQTADGKLVEGKQ